MLSIENAKPTAKTILNNIEVFEDFCMGKTKYTPSKFREVNQELSIGAVLLIGKCRYQRDQQGKRIYWKGLDDHEYDLGDVNNVNIMRDFPGFHAKRSLSLGSHHVTNSEILPAPCGKGNICIVTMEDGSVGIAPNYRMALRNAAIKMHLSSKFNYFSLANVWNRVWGNA